MGNDFLPGLNISKTISDNMRFARNFKPSTTTAQAQATDNKANAGTQDINPMLMLMLMQIVGKLTGTEMPQLDYATLFPNLTGAGVPNTTTPPVTQNPAVQYFENRFQALAAKEPEAPEIFWNVEETTLLRTEIAQGRIDMTQIGQALMYELDKTDPKNLPAVGGAIANLMESGDLNIVAFLQNDYLNQLEPARRDMLFKAVELSGLILKNGQPNDRFVAFLLDNLSKQNPNRASQPKTQTFIQQFMQDFYDEYKTNLTGPVGSVVGQILTLTGIQTGDDGKLIFA